MSTYEKEKGVYVLPSSAIISFRNALVKSVNDHQMLAYACAQAIHEAITQNTAYEGFKKGLRENLRKFPTNDDAAGRILTDVVRRLDPAGSGGWTFNAPKWDDSVREKAFGLLLARQEDRTLKFQAPKKKDLALLPAVTWRFENDECAVRLDPETRRVTWRVEENNHAVDRARESALGQAFFSALAKVNWTRATGGVIRYINEYDRDGELEGGSRARVVNALGPLGLEEQESDYPPALRRSLAAGRKARP